MSIIWQDVEYLKAVKVLRIARLGKISRIARLQNKVDEIENDIRGKAIEKDDEGHIYQYNSATLFSLGWTYNLGGTVIAMPEIWVQTLVFLIIQTLLASITCPDYCDSSSNAFDPIEGECDYCITTIEPDYSLMFLGLAAFLLGIFAQMLFDRWWQTRLLIEKLFAEIRDTCVITVSIITGKDNHSRNVRHDLVRWAILGAYLVEKEIDGKDNFREAVQMKYLKEREWDEIEKCENKNTYHLPYQWGFDTVLRLNESPLCTNKSLVHDLALSFNQQRKMCTDILMYLNTPMPYIYIHLMTLICKVDLLFTSIACGTLVGQAIHNKQPLTVAISYLIVLLANMLIEGLLRLHVVLSDPFGDDNCDFPWSTYMKDVIRQCKIFKEQHDKMPYNDDKKMQPYKGEDETSSNKNPLIFTIDN
jgi:hypothetical protein